MANIAGSYDQNADPADDFAPVPAGEYKAVIIESDIEPISKNAEKGKCLRLTWQIQDGEYSKRLVWQRLNMWPENMNNIEKVSEIAQRQFSSIRKATGKLTPQDSNELHHIPCAIRVTVRKDPNGQYADQNEVKAVKAGSSQAPTPPPANGQGNYAQQSGGTVGHSRPWSTPS